MLDPRRLGAVAVIAGVLGAQLTAILRYRTAAALYPFVAYPMYAAAAVPGQAYRQRRLQAVPCDDVAGARVLRPGELDQQSDVLTRQLAAIAADRPGAAMARTALSAAALRHLALRPCRLIVAERTIVMTRTGVDPSAFTHPKWTPVRAWPVVP